MRWSAADTANLLRIARASLGETQSHLLKGKARSYWAPEVFENAWALSDRTIRVTTGYMRERQETSLREKQRGNTADLEPQARSPMPRPPARSPRSTLSPMPQPPAPSPQQSPMPQPPAPSTPEAN